MARCVHPGRKRPLSRIDGGIGETDAFPTFYAPAGDTPAGPPPSVNEGTRPRSDIRDAREGRHVWFVACGASWPPTAASADSGDMHTGGGHIGEELHLRLIGWSDCQLCGPRLARERLEPGEALVMLAASPSRSIADLPDRLDHVLGAEGFEDLRFVSLEPLTSGSFSGLELSVLLTLAFGRDWPESAATVFGVPAEQPSAWRRGQQPDEAAQRTALGLALLLLASWSSPAQRSDLLERIVKSNASIGGGIGGGIGEGAERRREGGSGGSGRPSVTH